MSKQQVGLPMSPTDYTGLKQSVIPIKMVPREPTTEDRKYRVGQVFIVGDSPITGTEGNIWYLAKFDSNGDAIWSRFIGSEDYASTTQPGIIEIATDAEAVAGTSELLALVPSNIAPVLAEPPAIGGTTPASITGTTVTGDTVTAATSVTGDTVTGTTSVSGSTVTGNTVTGTTSVSGGTVSATTAMTCATLTASTSVSITGKTENSLPVFGASGLIDEAGPLADGQLLVGITGSAPVAATITAGTGISVTNSAGSIEIVNLGGTPTSYYTSANPVYATAATYTVASFFVRNSDDDGDISKDTSTTLDVSTTGLNGVAVSDVLTGTISASGTAVTGTSTTFTTDFEVGDVIYSTTDNTGRRITVITDDTSLTVESSWTITGGASYRRGGEAPSTHYYAYAATDGSTPGLLLSTRSVLTGDTLVDAPSGYTKTRQMKYVLTNNENGDLLNAKWTGTDCFYNEIARSRSIIEGLIVINGGAARSYSTVDASVYVPKISKLFSSQSYSAQSSVNKFFRSTGDTNFTQIEGVFTMAYLRLNLSSEQKFDYYLTSSALNMVALGYTVTEFV